MRRCRRLFEEARSGSHLLAPKGVFGGVLGVWGFGGVLGGVFGGVLGFGWRPRVSSVGFWGFGGVLGPKGVGFGLAPKGVCVFGGVLGRFCTAGFWDPRVSQGSFGSCWVGWQHGWGLALTRKHFEHLHVYCQSHAN